MVTRTRKAPAPVSPVAPAPVASPPVAPVHIAPIVQPVGKAQKGGHHWSYLAAYRAGYLPTATVTILNGNNPWASHAGGFGFWATVLAKFPAPSAPTVSEVVAIGTGMGLSQKQVIKHLAWLATWGANSTITIG